MWLLSGESLSTRALGWLIGAVLVAAVSFVDDLRPLPALPRLAAHGIGAVLLTIAGVQDRELPIAFALPLAFVWVALVTNVYNFMDGIDGLAATQAVVGGVALAVAGVYVANPLIAICGALLAAASAGFLVHNLPPARLFMGDVGSTFLGFNFAGLSLLGNLGVGGGRLPIEFGVVILAPFLFDSIVTLVLRIARGERWYEAHRSHYYQRLVGRGLSHAQVTSLYAGLAVLASLAATLGLVLNNELLRQALAVLAYLPMLLVVALVWRLEAVSGQQSAVSKSSRSN
jgi:UDP-N-acetylmuramyl pentapeptide phosphotransferase/UDP-N-acetylglucosamine-1-phosphate transferase